MIKRKEGKEPCPGLVLRKITVIVARDPCSSRLSQLLPTKIAVILTVRLFSDKKNFKHEAL